MNQDPKDLPPATIPPDMLLIQEKLLDALTPGFQAEFDPDEAEWLGAFEEDALSEEDALESRDDLKDAKF